MENAKNKLIYLLFFLAIVCFLVFLYVNSKGPVAMKKYEVTFEVTNSVGFNINGTALTYGRVIPGSESSKEINAYNAYDFPVKVGITMSDDLDGLIYIKDEVILEPSEGKSFLVFLNIPLNFTQGNYSGDIAVNFYKI